MKKLVLLAMSLAMCLSVSAQRYAVINLAPAPAQPQAKELSLAQKAPAAKVNLAANQRLLGYYVTDDWSGGEGRGVGFGQTMQLRLGARLSSDMITNFVGGKIVGLRYAMCAAESITKVFVQKEGQTTDVVSKDLTGTCQLGWNTVMFDTPWTIDNNTPFFIGYEGTIDGKKYSISIGNKDNPHADGLMAYGNLGANGVAWYNITAKGGVLIGDLSVQAIVELDNLAKQDLQLSKLILGSKFATSGKELPFSLVVRQNGTETANDYVLDVLFDGNKVGTINSTAALAGNTEQTVNGMLTVPAGTTYGEHIVKVKVATVNGTAPTENLNDDEVETSLKVFEQTMPRQKMLLEHYTSHSCTFCFLGDMFLEAIAKLRNDLAWVSIHGNQQAIDPMNFSKAQNISSYGNHRFFPSGSFNRAYYDDLAAEAKQSNGTDQTYIYPIGFQEKYISQVAPEFNETYISPTMQLPAFSSIDVKSNYDKAASTITVDVNLKGVDNVADMLKNQGLYVYLTEDSVVDRQFKNGAWVASYTHNHVLREVLTSEYGDAIEWNGTESSRQFVYNLPATYAADQNKTHTPNVKKMHVIAFVAPIAKKTGNNYREMGVDNCEICNITEKTSGIIDVNAQETEAQVVAIYTVSGQRIAEPQKGINIIVYSNGKAEKVMVNE